MRIGLFVLLFRSSTIRSRTFFVSFQRTSYSVHWSRYCICFMFRAEALTIWSTDASDLVSRFRCRSRYPYCCFPNGFTHPQAVRDYICKVSAHSCASCCRLGNTSKRGFWSQVWQTRCSASPCSRWTRVSGQHCLRSWHSSWCVRLVIGTLVCNTFWTKCYRSVCSRRIWSLVCLVFRSARCIVTPFWPTWMSDHMLRVMQWCALSMRTCSAVHVHRHPTAPRPTNNMERSRWSNPEIWWVSTVQPGSAAMGLSDDSDNCHGRVFGRGDVSRCRPVHDIGECVSLMDCYDRDTLYRLTQSILLTMYSLVSFFLRLVGALFIRLSRPSRPAQQGSIVGTHQARWQQVSWHSTFQCMLQLGSTHQHNTVHRANHDFPQNFLQWKIWYHHDHCTNPSKGIEKINERSVCRSGIKSPNWHILGISQWWVKLQGYRVQTSTLTRSRRRAVRAIDVRCAHVGVVVSRRILCEESHINAFEIGPDKYRVVGHRRFRHANA